MSLLNESINFFKNKKIVLTPDFWMMVYYDTVMDKNAFSVILNRQ